MQQQNPVQAMAREKRPTWVRSHHSKPHRVSDRRERDRLRRQRLGVVA